MVEVILRAIRRAHELEKKTEPHRREFESGEIAGEESRPLVPESIKRELEEKGKRITKRKTYYAPDSRETTIILRDHPFVSMVSSNTDKNAVTISTHNLNYGKRTSLDKEKFKAAMKEQGYTVKEKEETRATHEHTRFDIYRKKAGGKLSRLLRREVKIGNVSHWHGSVNFPGVHGVTLTASPEHVEELVRVVFSNPQNYLHVR